MSEFREKIEYLIEKDIIKRDYDPKLDRLLYWPIKYWISGYLTEDQAMPDIIDILRVSPKFTDEII